MNPVVEAIKTRRSVRSYQNKSVPKELVEAMSRCRQLGPNGAQSTALAVRRSTGRGGPDADLWRQRVQPYRGL